ncbi:hypothetical protein BV210_16765 [Halorientalis sp. IM1011]|uniref:hypothetical protein n=1 Tax=Halorientalis sp. IM1011 TaxID=1932360 RepID=UPI00097CC9BC|nr:hypothetical protein [Halorientalis sp. IM1011]AQL44264.1 hypothetical protein BV210_16765 [Halorientalis sp. IM1011]
MLTPWAVWPAHVGGGPPIPHWVVLLAVVPALLLAVGVAVLLVDRLLVRMEWTGSDEKRR